MKKLQILIVLAVVTVIAGCGSASPDPSPTTSPDDSTDQQVGSPTEPTATSTPEVQDPTSTVTVRATVAPNATAPSAATATPSPALILPTIDVSTPVDSVSADDGVLDQLTDQQLDCLTARGADLAVMAGLSPENPPPADLVIPILWCNIFFEGDSSRPAFTSEQIDCMIEEAGESGLVEMYQRGSQGEIPSLELMRALLFCEVQFGEGTAAETLTLEQLDCIIESAFAEEFEMLIQRTLNSPPSANLLNTIAGCGIDVGGTR